jgi:hypothetical protein
LTPGRISRLNSFPETGEKNMNDENMNEVADEPTPERVRPKTSLMALGGRPVAIIPRTFDEAYRIGNAAVMGKWAPRGWTKEQATLAILHGAEIGLPPMMSLQKICVINGRPSLWGDAVPAIALATGQLEDWSEGIRGDGDEMVAYCTVKRRGIKTPLETTFSVADARRAGLWDEKEKVRKQVWENGVRVWKDDQDNDSPWYRHPKRMLQMRARRAFRDAFADAFSGLYIAEELQDEPQMRDVTPQQVIHNPLQDDAEVADGREPSDEVPPKHVRTILDGQAAVDALTTPEPEDGAVVHVDGSVTRPGDHGHPTADEVRDMTEVSKPPRQARSKVQDAPQPEPASEPPPANKPAPAPNGGAQDWRGLGTKVWATLTGENYMAYLRKWTTAMAMAGGGPTYAVELRNRYVAERDIRNNLGTPLNADQQDEAKQIAAAAYKQLGGV